MSSSSRGRGNHIPLDNLTCPLCNTEHKTEGWLKFHLRKYHPDYKIVETAARAREENKYDIAAARKGLYPCPHIGIYCCGPGGKPPVGCLGIEECFRIEYQPWLARCFEKGERLDIHA